MSRGSALDIWKITSPATPLTGQVKVYPKADGLLYWKDDTAVERMAAASEPHDYTMAGTLTVKVGTGRIYMEGSYTVESIRASVGTAPTGAAVICDVNKNGTTLYTTQGNRPTIAVSTNTVLAAAPDVTTFVSGDYLTVDVDQIGSTVAGADLVVTVRLRRTA